MTDSVSPLRRGVVFPQGSIAGGPDELREYILGIEALGYDHLVVPDHILGVDPSHHSRWSGPYDVTDSFLEPFVLFGYLAGFSSLELVAGILVLSQRQTALAAKQAAEVDLLSRGHLRLGVGVGWNAPEFEGLGSDFETRGDRLDEQIVLLRRLWSEPVVDFDGAYHSLHGVGIAPLPQRSIPLWVAAERAPRALRRVGRLADGWMSMGPPVPETEAALRTIRDAAIAADRDPDAIGIQSWVSIGDGDLDRARTEVQGWIRFGATHIAMNTRGAGPMSARRHLDLAKRAAEAFE